MFLLVIYLIHRMIVINEVGYEIEFSDYFTLSKLVSKFQSLLSSIYRFQFK